MDTDSTPTLAAVPDHLRDLYCILRSEAERAQRAAQETADRYVAQAAAKKAAELEKQWEPILAAIRAAMPPALHEFVRRPDDEPEKYFSGYDHGRYEYRPCEIQLPGLAPIHAYVHNNYAYFYATRPECVNVDDGEHAVIWNAGTYYRGHWDFNELNTFERAFLDATNNAALLPAAQAEAARRNALAAQPDDDLTPEQEAILDRMKVDAAGVLLFNNAEHDVLAAGLLLIVHELHRVNDNLGALYDRNY